MSRGFNICVTVICALSAHLGLFAQEFVTGGDPCDRRVYEARELYDRGELNEMLALLSPCLNDNDLLLPQKRLLYRLLAEGHLYMRNYSKASEYAKALAEIDPQLKVFGVRRSHSDESRDLRTVIRTAQEFDAPDLLLLVGNIRYDALSIELSGGPATQFFDVTRERNHPQVTDVTIRDWSSVRGVQFGGGVEYQPYRLPFAIALGMRYRGIRSDYVEGRVLSDGNNAVFSATERQQWISPELWLSCHFAPRTFPVRPLDVSVRAGAGAEILMQGVLENAFLEHTGDKDWFGGQELDLDNRLDKKIFPSVMGGLRFDYRVSRQSVFAEIQYRFHMLDNYRYEIAEAFHLSDLINTHEVSLCLGLRYTFYKAFYK